MEFDRNSYSAGSAQCCLSHGADRTLTLVSDLTPLSALTGLRVLNLCGTSVSDVTPLAGLTGLQELNLGATPVQNVSALFGNAGLSIDGLSARRWRSSGLSIR